MNVKKPLTSYGRRKLARRLARAIPWIGTVIAAATVGGAIKRKGFFGGLLHTALDAIPFVGVTKNIVEAGRGRDFIRDRPQRIITKT